MRHLFILIISTTAGLILSLNLAWAEPIAEARALEDDKAPDARLADWDLEDLMNLTVTSVSKKEQKVSETAAAVFVITQEDIRRTAATSIPEALRMVPGIQVARVDANKWAISARGFNGRFANKLLVMIDGRVVYNPLFSGVIWETQDTVLEDVDRIEVIRGPGGTLWGENAVNGVINIITKHSSDTQGALISAGAGTEERGFGTVRYGGTIGDDLSYRVWGKYVSRDEGFREDEAHDDWQIGRGGFRSDWELNSKDSLTLQGSYYDGSAGQELKRPTLTPPAFFDTPVNDIGYSGGDIQFHWDHRIDDTSDFSFSMYYDRTELDDFDTLADAKINVFDVDIQHRLPVMENHELLWGLEYRRTWDTIRSSPITTLEPSSRTLNLFSGFLQDEFTLKPEEWYLTLGSKLTHNDFTGLEVQPNIRLRWTPSPDQTVWAAVSRAVRTPSRIEDDVQALVAGTPFGFARAVGDNDVHSENVIAYELGYRTQAFTSVSLDVTAFFNTYDNLVATTPTPSRLLDQQFGNPVEAEVFGAEVAADAQLFDWWRLRSGVTYLQMQFRGESRLPGAVGSTDKSPDHQFSLQSYMNVSEDIEINGGLRIADSLPSLNVPHYVEADINIVWRPREGLEFSLVGQNLLDSHHPEFVDEFLSLPSDVERGAYVLTRWRF